MFIFLINIPLFNGNKVFKQNTFLFFDPVTKNPCNETNYWIPLNQNTTCYRFVILTTDDSETNSKIKIMLDHNIGDSNYSSYKNVLKKKTKNWSRYNGAIQIIDQSTIFKIMKYTTKPTKSSLSKPPFKFGYYFSNSRYILKRKTVSEKRYWTKNVFIVIF